MNDMTTSNDKWKTTEKDDDSPLSKNNGKHIRYRKRLQQEREIREAYEDGMRQLEEDNYGGTD